MNRDLFSALEPVLKKENRVWLILMALLGVFLLVGPSIFEGENKTVSLDDADMFSENVWIQQQEQKLEELLSQMQGTGKTRVMITLESGEESVYAMNTRTDGTNTQKEHVLLHSGSAALVESVWMPQVQGVAVICEGAGDASVDRKITEIVSVLLGVSSNRISIAKMS